MQLRPNPNKDYQKLLDAAIAARRPYDREGWLNLAFYLNEQYVEWSKDTGSIRRIPRTDKTKSTPRPVVNKIMHYVQQERSMLLQAKPNADVMPATDDITYQSDAAVAKAYCEFISEPVNANFQRQSQRSTLWALIHGNGYLKWFYNPLLKRPDVISVSPFEVYPDPYAREFARCRYVIHSQFLDVEQVYEMFGVEVPPADVETADAMRTELLRGMGSSPVVSGVTVNELWYKPCRRHPKGLYVVWTGRTQLVPPGDYPYDHKQLPFTQVGSIERPDSQHFMAPVTYLRSAQMELNKYHAQKIMTRQAFAAPKWFVPGDAELEEMPDDSPHQVLKGTGTGEPKIITPTPMADNGDGEMIEQQMMHIVGLHEVSQAQVPGRVEAAKAIEMLKESDADRQATTLEMISAGISVGWWQMLMLAKQYVSAEVMVMTYSKDGLAEAKAFKASRMDPGMRIQVVMGTGLARSRAARQDQLMLLWQNGIIQDPEVMTELMEMPGPGFAVPNIEDIRLARNENLIMAGGTPVQANSWDNHAIHLREHNRYRKTQEFLHLPTNYKNVFEFHCQQHEQLQQSELMKQVQLAQLAAAAAGPAGAAPDPGGAGGGQGAGGAAGPPDPMESPQGIAGERDYVGHNLTRAGRPPGVR